MLSIVSLYNSEKSGDANGQKLRHSGHNRSVSACRIWGVFETSGDGRRLIPQWKTKTPPKRGLVCLGRAKRVANLHTRIHHFLFLLRRHHHLTDRETIYQP
jgi:hypothetical protein